MVFCRGSRTGEFYHTLALQASKAAIAMDFHRLGEATPEQYQTIQELSEILYEIVKGEDPINMNMMSYVVWPNKKDWVGTTVDDTKMLTWLFAKDIETFTEAQPERQSELLYACLDLSRKAQSRTTPLILHNHHFRRHVA